MPSTLSLSWATLAEGRAQGLDDLIALNWEEVEGANPKMPLHVNWNAMRSLERAGVLKSMILRKDGQFIGYSAYYVQPVLHHASTVWAVADVVYVDPDYRKGWAGVYIIRQGEKMLRELGVKVLYIAVKHPGVPSDLGYKRGRDSVGLLLQKLGFARFEEAWVKYL